MKNYKSILFNGCLSLFFLNVNAQTIKTVVDSLVIYKTGSNKDTITKTGFGLLLMGGSKEVDTAFSWFLQQSNGGDIVVLRASGADGYHAYFNSLAKTNSITTFIVDTRAKAFLPQVAEALQNAEAIFIAGGDQYRYVQYWKNSPIQTIINQKLQQQEIPIGGTSAGLAILGSFYFDAKEGSAISDTVLKQPFHPTISIGKNDFIQAPFLQHLITDSHYSQRKRQGRHIVMMAQLAKEFPKIPIKGLGIDEETAVCVDEKGNAAVVGKHQAYFLATIKAAEPEQMQHALPLNWIQNKKAVKTYAIKATTQLKWVFQLKKWQPLQPLNAFYYFVENGNLLTYQTNP
ncbi:MAG: cyanophycinase [Chitinophagaceae bacterium]